MIPSIGAGTIGDAFANATAETVLELFKNEAFTKESPFRNRPLTSEPDVVDVVVEWVQWYNNTRLHLTLGYRFSVQFAELYYDEITGALPDIAASKLEA